MPRKTLQLYNRVLVQERVDRLSVFGKHETYRWACGRFFGLSYDADLRLRL